MNSTPAPLARTEFGTFTFEHESFGIDYPAASLPGGDPVSPAEYGFHVVDTGGGCTAWRRDFTYRNEPVYMLITAADDASHELTPLGPIALGVYADSGEWFVVWHQAFGPFLDERAPYNIASEGI